MSSASHRYILARARAAVGAWAERLGAGTIDLSMTHARELAAAVCVVVDD